MLQALDRGNGLAIYDAKSVKVRQKHLVIGYARYTKRTNSSFSLIKKPLDSIPSRHRRHKTHDYAGERGMDSAYVCSRPHSQGWEHVHPRRADTKNLQGKDD